MLGNFYAFLSPADKIKHYFFQNILSGIALECQTAWKKSSQMHIALLFKMHVYGENLSMLTF